MCFAYLGYPACFAYFVPAAAAAAAAAAVVAVVVAVVVAAAAAVVVAVAAAVAAVVVVVPFDVATTSASVATPDPDYSTRATGVVVVVSVGMC